ncbi:MAG: helix-turn-helix transcriptional regulator [Bacteroidales bacterium]|nr:helix-turn-helix transcriptional regulator [Bacteroidales bacterium]
MGTWFVVLLVVLVMVVLVNIILCLVVFVLLPRSARQKIRLPRPRKHPEPLPAVSQFDENGNRIVLKDIYRKINTAFSCEHLYLKSDITLISLSHEVGANKTYVSQAIRLYSGMNYSQYVNSWRISHAMETMSSGEDVADEDMASRCGYKALSTYISAFQSIAGITPKEWRKLKKSLPLPTPEK